MALVGCTQSPAVGQCLGGQLDTRQHADKTAQETTLRSPDPASESVTPSQTARAAILVIDDEPGMQRALTRLLQRDGHAVTTAVNGVDGLTALGQGSFQVILCDMRMPMLDGPGFYREVQRRYPHLASRMIFFTGDAMTEDVRDFFADVGRPHLLKPFKAQEVRRLVQQVLDA